MSQPEQEKEHAARERMRAAFEKHPNAGRVEEIEHGVELALARKYGEKLPSIMVSDLVDGVITRPEILGLLGTVDDAPADAAGYAQLATALVADSPLAQRALAFADAEAKLAHQQAALEELPPSRKMAMARAGELDAYLAAEVQRRLEAGL